MPRTIIGVGAFGETVRKVQHALVDAGFDTKGTDGRYGADTTKATTAFQVQHGIQPTGIVDELTWQTLMHAPVPPVSQRSLQLTAGFEGHGFELAIGNFDGALITWGIIGFTLLNGEIQRIVLAVDAADPTLVPRAFGDRAGQLLALMRAARPEQTAFAEANTVMPGSGLAEPWKSGFAAFGALPAVQSEQMALVQTEYLDHAIHTARGLGLTSELALALCFDIHVQDGGIKDAAMASIQAQRTASMGEAQLLPIIARAVGNAARPAFAADVLSRKLTIATGQGTVHSTPYVLDNWGLRVDVEAEELTA